MARISDLPALPGSATEADAFPVSRAGQTYKMPINALGGNSLASRSLRFPDAALQFAGQFGLLKQSKTNMPAILNAADSYVIGKLRLPLEKIHQNRNYELAGNAPGQPGTFALRLVSNGAQVGGTQLSWAHRQAGGGGSTLYLGSAEFAFEDVVFRVGRTLNGADIEYRLDLWNCADGSKTAGTASVNPAGINGIAAGALAQTHWYFGATQQVANEPTITTAAVAPSGGPPGVEFEFFGIYNGAAISDANMQAIALGGNPLTVLTAANFGYYRRLLGTDAASLAPVAGTSDTTSSTTVLGTFLPGGQIGRQDSTNYLTLNRLPDGFVFGLRGRELGRDVPFAGSCAGTAWSGVLHCPKTPVWVHREVRHLNGYIWGRIVLPDGTALVPWTRLVARVNAGTEGVVTVERSRFAVGYKFALIGQSQVHYMTRPAGTVFQALARTVQGAPGGSLALTDYDNIAYGAAPQIRVYEGNVRWADGPAAMIDILSAALGCPVCIVGMGASGSDPLDWIETAGTRPWSGDEATLALAGKDVSAVIWQWYTSRQSAGATFGTDVLDPVIKGIGANADTNWIGNGLFEPGFALGVSGFTRTSATTTGPFDTDQYGTTGGIALAREASRLWSEANGIVYGPEITDMEIDSAGGPHEAGTLYGTVRLAQRMAETCLRAIGVSTRRDSTIGSPVFNAGKTTITLTVTQNTIGKLTVFDPATFAANVQGFEVSTNGGSTWSRSTFTAAISATPATRNKVVLTKASGDWTAFSAGQVMVRYCWGGPLAYGKSVESSALFNGVLLDGSDDNGGYPIRPMAATVVV